MRARVLCCCCCCCAPCSKRARFLFGGPRSADADRAATDSRPMLALLRVDRFEAQLRSWLESMVARLRPTRSEQRCSTYSRAAPAQPCRRGAASSSRAAADGGVKARAPGCRRQQPATPQPQAQKRSRHSEDKLRASRARPERLRGLVRTHRSAAARRAACSRHDRLPHRELVIDDDKRTGDALRCELPGFQKRGSTSPRSAAARCRFLPTLPCAAALARARSSARRRSSASSCARPCSCAPAA